jgi:mannose-6-phosphate isomerase-like protein (cupin superfamily)
MCIKPGEDIGEEVHPTTDQFFRIEEGKGKAVVDGKEINITDGSSILIKSGRVHNIINNSNKPLRLYSLYSPPQHRDGLIQKEK